MKLKTVLIILSSRMHRNSNYLRFQINQRLLYIYMYIFKINTLRINQKCYSLKILILSITSSMPLLTILETSLTLMLRVLDRSVKIQ